MGTFREPDPLADFLNREHARLLDCLLQSDSTPGAGRAAKLAEARSIIEALAAVETEVLYAAFSRVRLRPETQALLDDSRGNRREQLEALDRLAHKRAPRLRKIAVLEVADLVRSHGERLTSLLTPVLASQLPRPVHRAICSAATARYEGTLGRRDGAEQQPPTQGAMSPNA